MEVTEAIKSRYSEREYSDTPVDREQVNLLLEAAHEAPCSCNLQLMQYVVVDDPGLREKLSRVATHKMMWAPTNIFFFIDPRYTVKRHSAVMGLGAAMQNMSLTATSLGLATCPMAGFVGDREIKNILGVPEHLEPILILGVGYPKYTKVQKIRQRLPLSSMAHYNQFDPSHASFINPSSQLSDWSVSQLVDYRRRIGPVYRYDDRFLLQIFPRQAYEKAVEVLIEKSNLKDKQVLDLFSFDSCFAKYLFDRSQGANITVSDYFPEVTSQIQNLHEEITFVSIDENNVLGVADSSQDVVTAVEKLQFTPNLEALVREVARVLKSGGQFYVTLEKKPWLKRLYYACMTLYRTYSPFVTSNVYEGSPYYKIGPYREVRMASLKKTCSRYGMSIQATGSASYTSRSRFGLEISYALFTKD